jgi:hypothetical protein
LFVLSHLGLLTFHRMIPEIYRYKLRTNRTV